MCLDSIGKRLLLLLWKQGLVEFQNLIWKTKQNKNLHTLSDIFICIDLNTIIYDDLTFLIPNLR